MKTDHPKRPKVDAPGGDVAQLDALVFVGHRTNMQARRLLVAIRKQRPDDPEEIADLQPLTMRTLYAAGAPGHEPDFEIGELTITPLLVEAIIRRGRA